MGDSTSGINRNLSIGCTAVVEPTKSHRRCLDNKHQYNLDACRSEAREDGEHMRTKLQTVVGLAARTLYGAASVMSYREKARYKESKQGIRNE